MRLAIIFLLAGIVLMLGFYRKFALPADGDTVDFHIHDTYFVVGKVQTAGAAALFLLGFFALGGTIGTRFIP